MKPVLSMYLLVGLLASCGPRPAPTEEPGPAPAADAGPAALPAPPMPAPTGDARADLLAKLTTFMPVDVSLWPAEMEPVLYPNGADALLGAGRDELLTALGPQNTGPEFQGEDRLAWHIGTVAEGARNFPPVLVVVFDAAGVAVEAHFQLSM